MSGKVPAHPRSARSRPDVPFRHLDFPSSRRYLLPNARSRRSSGVKIINTDGLVLFGPGSEWLWFMLQFLALATTFYAIYRQLRLQASQGAVEQVEGLNREYESERMLRYRLAIAIAQRDEIAYPRGASSAVMNFWEGLGALVRKGHLDANLYWDSFGNLCQLAWASLEPFVQQGRADAGEPLIGEHFEWLAAKMTSLDRRAGSVIVIDQAFVARFRERSIASLEEMLRVEEALRAVVTTPPPVPAAAPLAAQSTAPAAEG
jgi:hypothetical protein